MNTAHIAHAMRNEEARQAMIWFNNPFDLLHWSMPLVEGLMIAGACLSLLHAVRSARREHDPAYVWTWLATIFYGLIVELLSYNFVDNFWHGEFTVMLYYNHLPLYIAALYPAIVYPTFMLVRRMGLADAPCGRLREAACAAFAMQMFYVPFDNMGPMLHWWVWDSAAVSLQPFWYSVPSTSYLWASTLAMAFVVSARWLLWERARSRGYGVIGWSLSALGVGLATNLLSVLLQSPFTVLSQGFGRYFLAGAGTAILICVNAWIYRFRPREAERPLDGWLRIFPLLWVSFFACLYLYQTDVIFATYVRGTSQLGTPAGNYGFAALGIVMVVLVYLTPARDDPRSRASTNAPEQPRR